MISLIIFFNFFSFCVGQVSVMCNAMSPFVWNPEQDCSIQSTNSPASLGSTPDNKERKEDFAASSETELPASIFIKTTASSKSLIFECGKISTCSEIKDVNKARFSIVFFAAVFRVRRCVTSLKTAELQHVGVRLPSSKIEHGRLARIEHGGRRCCDKAGSSGCRWFRRKGRSTLQRESEGYNRPADIAGFTKYSSSAKSHSYKQTSLNGH